MWAAAAAAALVLTFGGANEYRRQQTERKNREAVVALRITAEKLNHVRAKVLKLSDSGIKEN
jgi:hypothetical protein